MSDAALAKLALPSNVLNNRDYVATAFSPDGNRFAFVALDRATIYNGPSGSPGFKRCTGWVYDLTTGLLNEMSELPPSACEHEGTFGAEIAWAGSGLTLFLYSNMDDPAPMIGAIRVRQTQSAPNLQYSVEPREALPQADREIFDRSVAAKPAALKAEHAARFHKPPTSDATTTDGLYSIVSIEPKDDSPNGCETTVAVSTQTHTRHVVTKSCPYGGGVWHIDRDRDLIFYSEIRTSTDKFANLVEFDLKTDTRRSFNFPLFNFNSFDREPSFFLTQALPNGATRVVYIMRGDCNPADSDYAQPSQPVDEGSPGLTPNQSSVCFIAIPPPPSKPTPHLGKQPAASLNIRFPYDAH
jgi:hypothetical protein